MNFGMRTKKMEFLSLRFGLLASSFSQTALCSLNYDLIRNIHNSKTSNKSSYSIHVSTELYMR